MLRTVSLADGWLLVATVASLSLGPDVDAPACCRSGLCWQNRWSPRWAGVPSDGPHCGLVSPARAGMSRAVTARRRLRRLLVTGRVGGEAPPGAAGLSFAPSPREVLGLRSVPSRITQRTGT